MAGSILVVGLLGTLQAIMFAGTQNSFANKMTRASQIAHQARTGLELKGWARAATFSGTCLSGTSRALAGGLETLSTTPCVVDLDLFESGASAVDQVVPGYPARDGALFRRVVVVMPGTGTNANLLTTYAVVVSWNQGLTRRFVRQVFMLYNPAFNPARALRVEL